MDKPDLRDLMTTTDIGRRLGISRQGAQQISVADPTFPEPIGKLGHYMIWWRPEIEQWVARRRPRFSGRLRLRRVA